MATNSDTLRNRPRRGCTAAIIVLVGWLLGGIAAGYFTDSQLHETLNRWGSDSRNNWWWYTIRTLAMTSMAFIVVFVIAVLLTSWTAKLRWLPIPLSILICVGTAMMPIYWFGYRYGEDWHQEEELDVEHDSYDMEAMPFRDDESYWHPVVTRKTLPFTVEINYSPATFLIFMFPEEREIPFSKEPLLPSYADAIAHAREKGFTLLPSTSMVQFKAKYFGERLLAALVRHVQGASSADGAGKAAFLAKLIESLSRHDPLDEVTLETIAYLAASLRLGGRELPVLFGDTEKISQELEKAFLEQGFRSKAISFYSADETLTALFQQDRFLQQGISLASAQRIMSVLADNPKLLDHYQDLLTFDSVIANPPRAFSPLDLLEVGLSSENDTNILDGLLQSPRGQRLVERSPMLPNQPDRLAIFPAATTREHEIFDQIYAGQPNLPQQNVVNRFIRALRSGEISLEPQPDSGWYDYQSYAMAPLVLTDTAEEAEKLWLHKDYKKHLIETYKVFATHQREKHARLVPPSVLLGGTIGMPLERTTVTIGPAFSVEPTATCYYRTAQAFQYLLDALPIVLGEHALQEISFDDARSVEIALTEIVELFHGLYLRVCQDIGMPPSEEGALEGTARNAALARADQWLAVLEDDPALQQDTRVAVPVLVDAQKERSRYWMNVGIQFHEIDVGFQHQPSLRLSQSGAETVILEGGEPTQDGKNSLEQWFWDHNCDLERTGVRYHLPVEIFMEGDGPAEPFTREEFRSLCDAAGTPEQILHDVSRGGSNRMGRFVIVAAFFALAGIIAARRLKRRS